MAAEQQFQRAVEYFHAGNLKQAESVLGKLLRRHPGQPDILHLLSVIALQTDKPETAARHLDQIIAANPQAADMHDLLGVTLRRMDRCEEAIKSFEKAISINSKIAKYHYHLANTLRYDGQLDRAIDHYEQAIALEPSLTDARYNLGQCFTDMGRLEDAEEVFRQVVHHAPDDIDAHICLANALSGQGNREGALVVLRNATAITSGGASVQVKIGNAVYGLGHYAAAIQCFDQALSLQPGLPAALNAKGLALRDRGDTAAAKDCFRQALAADTGNLAFHYHLADLLERTNNKTEAQAVVEQGLAMSADDPEINLVKARLERREGDLEAAIERLTRILENVDGQFAFRDAFHFELGRLYDRLEDSDRAYEHFCEGNRLFSLSWPTQEEDKARALDAVRRHQETFVPGWCGSWSEDPPHSGNGAPVFLMGFSRTGSTLLNQILGSHSSIQVMEEASAVFRVRKRLEERDNNYPDCLAQLSEQDIVELRAFYFEEVDAVVERKPETVLIDKLPLHTIDAGLIHRLFSGSPIIFALRHPCDVCLSCMMQFFSWNTANVNFSTLEDTAAYYEEVMTLWSIYRDVLSLNVHEVCYEDLVNDMESEARRLLDFLGLGWEDSVLEYTQRAERQEHINTVSYDQVTEKIYTRGRYRWHRYREHLAPILPRLRPFIEKFGYEDN
jgi:tetratricopeptide (TPR) repeat protein